jgi:aryl-phospho-beta-D-glucosidase BglC (GH1 family)
MFAQGGFNIVRLPVNWAYLEPTQGTFNGSYLRIIDQDVTWARQNNLYILIDMHQWNWSQWFIDDGASGNGAPVWTVTQYAHTLEESQEAAHNFWSNATLQSHLISAWAKIAAHYANNPWVAGYDLFNEPRLYPTIGPTDPSSLTKFYLALIARIRSVDAKHLIFLEPSEYPPQSINQPNIVWSPHFYTLAFAASFNPNNSTATSIMAAAIASDYNQYVVVFGKPLWYGEFSGLQGPASSECAWDQYSIKLFRNYAVGWAWWAWGPQWHNMQSDYTCVQSALAKH